MPWQCKINGKKHLNGTRYGMTLKGVLEIKSPKVDVFTMMQGVLAHVQDEAADMAHPDSLQISIFDA